MIMPANRAVSITANSTITGRPLAYFTGLVLLATAAMMMFPAIADLYYGNNDWKAFAFAGLLTTVPGALLTYFNKGALKTGLSLRQAFLLTPLSWMAVSIFSAIPFYLSDHAIIGGNIASSVFEAVSGITTTGATVMSGLDEAAPGILLWRAILQWMGGIGIIGTAIAILPALGIGGMQLFRTESSDRSDKAMPRVRQIAKVLIQSYVALTLLAVIVYWFAGMRMFDAVAHAMTSIATGGYSTSDASFGRWEENGIQWFASLFMLSGTLPFVLYVRFIAGDRLAFWDRQVKTLAAFLAVTIGLLGSWLYLSGYYALEPAYRHAAFNVISVVTTTGYASADYSLWGNAIVGVFFGLTFVGGCTGSTSGGIKIFRFEVLAIMLKAHFMRLLYPHGVFPRYYGERKLDDDVVASVVAFFVVFFVAYAVLTISLMAFDLDFLTSASGAASAISNVGPGLGDIIGPAGTFGSLPDGAKWLLSFGMMLGRLELFTVLVLFIPRFWRG
ncbi:Trk system potassium uptake protein TrkH [compost metagenome]